MRRMCLVAVAAIAVLPAPVPRARSLWSSLAPRIHEWPSPFDPTKGRPKLGPLWGFFEPALTVRQFAQWLVS